MESESIATRSTEDSALEALRQSALGGRFTVIRLLGTGAMGTVHLAEDIKLQRHVAIKTVKAELVKNEAFRKRIERECLLHAKVGPHQHTVTLFDKLEIDDHIHLVMEYVEGETLQTVLEHHTELGTTLSTVETLTITAQILDALSRIHSQGIVHRDIKPSNIMIAHDEAGGVCAKLMDFGISRLIDEDDQLSRLTNTESGGPGTPLYMAPEQIDANTFGPITPVTDVYATGALLYQLFCGRPPFKGTLTEVLRAHIAVPAPPINVHFKGPMPPGLPQVISRALEKQPYHRFESAKAFRAELVRILVAIGSTATGLTESPSLNDVDSTTRISQLQLKPPTLMQTMVNGTTALRLYVRRQRNVLALTTGVVVFLVLFACTVLYVATLFQKPAGPIEDQALGVQIQPDQQLKPEAETVAVPETSVITATIPPDTQLPTTDVPPVTAGLQPEPPVDPAPEDDVPQDDSGLVVSAPEYTVGEPVLTSPPTDAPPDHIVQPGESLSKIAAIYAVTVPDLQWWNGLLNANSLEVGQPLHISEQPGLPPREEFLAKVRARQPAPKAPPPATPTDPITQAVEEKPKDTAPVKTESEPEKKPKKGFFKRILGREQRPQ